MILRAFAVLCWLMGAGIRACRFCFHPKIFLSHIFPQIVIHSSKGNTVKCCDPYLSLWYSAGILNNTDRLELVRVWYKTTEKTALDNNTDLHASEGQHFRKHLLSYEDVQLILVLCIKKPAAKPHNLSYVSRAHLVGGENCLSKAVIWPRLGPPIHKYKQNKYFSNLKSFKLKTMFTCKLNIFSICQSSLFFL